MNFTIKTIEIKIQIKKRTKENILCRTTVIPKKYPLGMNSRTELRPGPNVIPRELTATKIAENLL